MKEIKLFLQLFAEGGDGGATGAFSADAGQTAGEQSAPAAGGNANEPTEETFESLIGKGGRYEQEYKERTEKLVQRRLRNSKEASDKLKALDPVLTALSSKYGVDSSDAQALLKAIDSDNSYWEEQAANEGLTVDQLKHIRQLEARDAMYSRQMQEEAQRRSIEEITQKWANESNETKAYYPQFDFDTEIENEDFADLIKAGVNVKTAYEVVHQSDILGGAMQYTAQQVQQAVVNNIQSRGRRPAENGSSAQSAATTKIDISKLTLKEMEDLEARAARGERITFT